MSFRIDESMTPDENIQAALEDGCVTWCGGYCEPGYDCGEKGILFANWNAETKFDPEENKFITVDDSMPKLCKMAEELGYDIEWSDQWSECSGCNKAYRTDADSYGWTQYASEVGGEEICGDCIQEDPEEYLEELASDHSRALPTAIGHNIDLEEHGYKHVENEFEVGYHHGQDDDHQAIGETLVAAGIEKFIFAIDGKGQFDMQFSVWVKEEDLERATQALKMGKTRFDPGTDPASVMERGLREATVALAQLPEGPGVKVVTIKGDTAKAKLVSPEDFVAGKALEED